MSPDRAIAFMRRADYARDNATRLYVTGAELAELLSTIEDPPDYSDPRPDDLPHSHPEWLPPYPLVRPGMVTSTYVFNGVLVVVDAALAIQQVAEAGP